MFATGFEKYLSQGVAPSLGLARIFATFRQWLLAVYAHFKGQLPGVALPDEVRGVFDRMLAAEPEAELWQGRNFADVDGFVVLQIFLFLKSWCFGSSSLIKAIRH